MPHSQRTPLPPFASRISIAGEPFGHAAHAVNTVRVGIRWYLLARKNISALSPEQARLIPGNR